MPLVAGPGDGPPRLRNPSSRLGSARPGCLRTAACPEPQLRIRVNGCELPDGTGVMDAVTIADHHDCRCVGERCHHPLRQRQEADAAAVFQPIRPGAGGDLQSSSTVICRFSPGVLIRGRCLHGVRLAHRCDSRCRRAASGDAPRKVTGGVSGIARSAVPPTAPGRSSSQAINQAIRAGDSGPPKGNRPLRGRPGRPSRPC